MRRLIPLLLLPLAACNAGTRLSEIGEQPALASIDNPVAQPGYVPVSLPMPAPQPAEYQANSLWRSGNRGFFKDQRATRIGDILTVLITIEDSAKLQNQTQRSRDSVENAGVTNLLGFESKLDSVLPDEVVPASLATANSQTSNRGSGQISRSESVTMRLAAIVTQQLPNGNLVIQGRQQVRVNFDLRELQVAGVIRPSDIQSDNTISYDKIAEARMAYGGRGQIMDMQQPRYGQQVFDVIFPF